MYLGLTELWKHQAHFIFSQVLEHLPKPKIYAQPCSCLRLNSDIGKFYKIWSRIFNATQQQRNYAIKNAVLNGHEEVDEKYRINSAVFHNHAIRIAASSGYVHVVKYFMEEVDSKYGIDPPADDNNAIRYAASQGLS